MSPRPVIVLAGKNRPDVANSLIAWTYSEASRRLELVLTNQGNDGTFLYSDERSMRPGSTLSLSFAMGDEERAFFSGAIVSLAPSFSGEPTIKLVAREEGTRPAASGTVHAVYGENLLEFHPVLEEGVITGQGVTELNLDLRPGTSIAVSRVGRVFSRKYAVESSVHQFDAATGGRTTFVATARRSKGTR